MDHCQRAMLRTLSFKATSHARLFPSSFRVNGAHVHCSRGGVFSQCYIAFHQLLESNTAVRSSSSSGIDQRSERNQLGIQPTVSRNLQTRGVEADVPENAPFTEEIVELARAGLWDEALETFEAIGEKNTIVYTAILDAALKCRRFKEGVRIFEKMQALRVERNVATYTCAIMLHARRADYLSASKVWQEVLHRTVKIDEGIITAIMTAAANAGDVAAAESHLAQADAERWPVDGPHFGCLLAAYRKVGDAEKALQILPEMRRRKIKPTIVHYHTAVGVYNRVKSRPARAVIAQYVYNIRKEMIRDDIRPTVRFMEEMIQALLGGGGQSDASIILRKLPVHVVKAFLNLVESQKHDRESWFAKLKPLLAEQMSIAETNITPEGQHACPDADIYAWIAASFKKSYPQPVKSKHMSDDQVRAQNDEPSHSSVSKTRSSKRAAASSRETNHEPSSIISALKGRKWDAVKSLVDLGSDIEQCDSSGKTPLMIAATIGQVDIMQYLLLCGSAIEVKDNSGNTALLCAVHAQRMGAVQLLLDHDASTSVGDAQGWSSLHISAYQGNLGLTKLLVSRGAKQRSFSNDRERPLDIARRLGHKDVEEYLHKCTFSNVQHCKDYTS